MEFMKKVNEISKAVGKTASETYSTVADKSGKLVEEAKLKISIADKEGEIKKIYEEIGKSVYDEYKSGEDVGKAYTKESKKIDKLNSEIKEMEEKIYHNKGLRVCKECGEVIAIDSTFCSNCGSKQKAVKIKEEKKEEVKEELKEQVCPECGTISDPKAKFCGKCGYKFEK